METNAHLLVKKYIVILSNTMYGVEQSANKMLNNGWVPVGGISVSGDNEANYRYYQAMMHENYDESLLSYEQGES